MGENFQPPKHLAPDSGIEKIIFYIRLLLDFQTNTIYRSLKKILPGAKGEVLDIGCGNSPFKHLLDDAATKYFGLDVYDSEDFKYQRADITRFDGKNIPFADNKFDIIFCTEVLEHVAEPASLINEVFRVLKSGGEIIFSIPWSARFHYQPFDFYRYTPTALKNIFSQFRDLTIESRGTDVSVIASKIIVVYSRQILSLKKLNLKAILSLFLVIIEMPILLAAIIIGHLSIIYKIGSADDCLGYLIRAKK
jgi:SAM-dependent methyltransferase